MDMGAGRPGRGGAGDAARGAGAPQRPRLAIAWTLLAGAACFVDQGATPTTSDASSTSGAPSSTSSGSSSEASTTLDDTSTGPETTTGGCPPGYGDCVAPGDGACETPLDVSLEHCGGCDQPCDDRCVVGECVAAKLIFVTGAGFKGDFGGADSASALCTTFAAEAGYEGSFRAWLSGVSGPADSFTPSELPYVRPDGEVVAVGLADLLDGSLDRPINVDEHGDSQADPSTCGSTVWSNTLPDGTPADGEDCGGWTMIDAVGGVANYNALDERWSDPSHCEPATCDKPHPLICVEQ